MGYSLTIGNAVLKEYPPEENDGELYARYEVEGVKRDDAPAYGEPTDFTNERWPSYSAWSEFAREAGIYDMFFSKDDGLIREHPGCFSLNINHLRKVEAAISNREKSNGGKLAGMHDMDKDWNVIDNGKDPTLARLKWLEYWIFWAIENCDKPAMQNT